MADCVVITSESEDDVRRKSTRERKVLAPAVYISSDSEEDCKIVNKRKRKKSSESEDEYVPDEDSSPKQTKGKGKANAAAKKCEAGTDETGEDDETKPMEPPAVKKKRAPRKKKATGEGEEKPKPKKEPAVKKVRAPRKKAATGEGGAKPAARKRAVGAKKLEPKAEGSNEEIAHTSEDVDIPFIGMEWNAAEVLAQIQHLDLRVAHNVTRLLDEDNTIPFIARYRKELTDNMEPEKLRHVKDAYENLKAVKQKAAFVMKSIAKLGKLTPLIERCICCSISMSELDHIYAPYKAGSKRTLAERARQLGLEDAAMALLEGTSIVQPHHLVKFDTKGLATLQDVELGLQHIMADVLSKDKDLLDTLRRLKQDAQLRLECCQARATKETTKETKETKAVKGVKTTKAINEDKKLKAQAEGKFDNYFNFSAPVKFLKPHQVLAINRGESLKVLTVKVVVPDWVQHRLHAFCSNRWFHRGLKYADRHRLLDISFKDAYTRLIQPLLVRQVRTELTQEAERAAVEVFATNLKKLLLSPPLRGKTILGIDPGFRNGCKLAVTTHMGGVLLTDVIYPHMQNNSNFDDLKLRDILRRHSCELIALGNGTACRETESYLSHLIQSGWFRPLDVKYTIVSEQGASIYSCSPLAKKEFPEMDPNTISAVSLARRVQDPLCELVKVEPKHLGVGMYQHDVPEKQLSSTLDEVVVECVSFVGVDINTASDTLLRRIAGLNVSRASKIIEWRSSHGPFLSRAQVKQVKGIGVKTFEQCAGFIRILPETAQFHEDDESKPKKLKLSDDAANSCLNPLDRTWIHPESYTLAHRFLAKCDVSLNDFGKPEFTRNIRSTITRVGLSSLATEFGVPEPQMRLVCDGLLQPDHDLRSQFQEPLFRRGVTSLQDLNSGDILTGRVQNVTHFGSFVDIGVGNDGLIPVRFQKNMRPQLGDRVEVRVMSVEIQRRRISLELLRIL